MTDLQALLAVNAVPGLSRVKIRLIRKHISDLSRLFTYSQNRLQSEFGLSPLTARKIKTWDVDGFLKREEMLIREHGVRILADTDPAFPENLKHTSDAPLLLYSQGGLDDFPLAAVAIVGSRRASIYGLNCAKRLASEMGAAGWTIVSGLARGIDTAAHQGSLQAGAVTIAVLGSGLAQLYPPENRELARTIAQKGAVVSEFPMEAPPLAYHFPQRNRIVCGLCLGVVVVEASQKSGALITSRLALEEGREVFAVPGNVDRVTSWGVNHLIQQGAKLVSHAGDILEELQPQVTGRLPAKDHAAQPDHWDRDPSEDAFKPESELLNLLGKDTLHIDRLQQLSRLPMSLLAANLLSLEMKKKIKQLPGKMYCRTR